VKKSPSGFSLIDKEDRDEENGALQAEG